MPFPMIVVIIVAAIIASIVCAIIWCESGTSDTDKIKLKKIILLAMSIGLMFVAWLIVACQTKETIDSSDVYRVQVIQDNDGSKFSLIVVNGEIVNLTEILDKFFEDGIMIKRTERSSHQFGINWLKNGKNDLEYVDFEIIKNGKTP